MKSFPVLFSSRLVLLILVLISIGCNTNKRTVSTNAVEASVIKEARKYIGASYKYAARGPRSFDCSGLVEYVYAKEGYSIRGSASKMSKIGKAKKLKDASGGDLIFYKSKGKITHVSIISKVRHNQLWVIHSTSSRGVIEEEILNSSYWRNKIYKVVAIKDLK